jgi:hypothetical protein
MADFGRFDVRDTAALNVGRSGIKGPDAVSRFTKTPIKFTNVAYARERLGDMFDVNKVLEQDSASGEYAPDTGISVMVNAPSYDRMQQAIAHEDTHAALMKAGVKPPPTIYGPGILGKLAMMTGQRPPSDILANGFLRSGYRGSLEDEIPAQANAFRVGDLPGVTQDDADRYSYGLQAIVPPETANQLKRINSAFKASQRFMKEPK